MCGDVDGNGFVDNQDLNALLNHVFYGIAINEWAGDMDGNGDINILDERLLMKHICSQYDIYCTLSPGS